MSTVKVRNVVLGEGMPKICVPIVATTKDAIINEAKAYDKIPVDIVEWRADWFDNLFDNDRVLELLKELRTVLREIPILFTIRTKAEGGEKDIDKTKYAELTKLAAESGYADLVDIEVFTGDDIVRDIIETAHKNGVKVVASNHDFDKTPAKDDIVTRLAKMSKLNADIPKIAVMPQSPEDVLTLLAATAEYNKTYGDKPIITMSMKGLGMVSRVSSEIFGSCLTFGSAVKASAPGQIGVMELKYILDVVHKNI